jgi:hypothetical protein
MLPNMPPITPFPGDLPYRQQRPTVAQFVAISIEAIMVATARCCAGLISVVLAFSTLGCGLSPNHVWVYIDNAGDEPLVVSVDGKEAATIAAGECGELKYAPGEYRFVIKRGSETLCDLSRKLEKSDKFGSVRKYLFNPDKLNVYAHYEVKYGGSRLDGVMEASLLKFQKDEQIKNKYIYGKLLKEIQLVPTDAWNDITGVEYVLTAPPETMLTRSGSSQRVTVLDHIDRDAYDRLAAAAKVESPTQNDIDSLDELIEDILANSL